MLVTAFRGFPASVAPAARRAAPVAQAARRALHVRSAVSIPSTRLGILVPRAQYPAASRAFFSSRNGGNDGDSATGAAQAAAEAAEAGGDSPDAAAAAALEAEVAALREELKNTRDKVLYTAAEIENVRAIAKRDVASARQYATQSFAKALLDVADNLQRAIAAVPPEARNPAAASGNGSNGGGGSDAATLATLLEGVEMTERQLHKVFGTVGLQQFGVVGDTFDPQFHEALFEIPNPSGEPGTIGQVLKPGYRLHDRVIRAAQVGTVKKL